MQIKVNLHCFYGSVPFRPIPIRPIPFPNPNPIPNPIPGALPDGWVLLFSTEDIK